MPESVGDGGAWSTSGAAVGWVCSMPPGVLGDQSGMTSMPWASLIAPLKFPTEVGRFTGLGSMTLICGGAAVKMPSPVVSIGIDGLFTSLRAGGSETTRRGSE
jgi:hypothetical protein